MFANNKYDDTDTVVKVISEPCRGTGYFVTRTLVDGF